MRSSGACTLAETEPQELSLCAALRNIPHRTSADPGPAAASTTTHPLYRRAHHKSFFAAPHQPALHL